MTPSGTQRRASCLSCSGPSPACHPSRAAQGRAATPWHLTSEPPSAGHGPASPQHLPTYLEPQPPQPHLPPAGEGAARLNSPAPFNLNLGSSHGSSFPGPFRRDEHSPGGSQLRPCLSWHQNHPPGLRDLCPECLNRSTPWSCVPICWDNLISVPQTRPTGHGQGASPAPSLQASKPGELSGNSKASDVHQGCVKATVSSLLCPKMPTCCSTFPRGL